MKDTLAYLPDMQWEHFFKYAFFNPVRTSFFTNTFFPFSNMTKSSVSQRCFHVDIIHTTHYNQSFCIIQFRKLLPSSQNQVTFVKFPFSITNVILITTTIEHMHKDQIKLDIWSMFDTFKKQLHSHVGLQTNITNNNHLRCTIITHLRHSKVTRSIRYEELIPWCNL